MAIPRNGDTPFYARHLNRVTVSLSRVGIDAPDENAVREVARYAASLEGFQFENPNMVRYDVMVETTYRYVMFKFSRINMISGPGEYERRISEFILGD